MSQAAAPGKSLRTFGIPTPGKTSGIPTPGRFRSASNVTVQPVLDTDNYASRALLEAIKANDPAQHRASSTYNSSSPSSPSSSFSAAIQSGRRSVTGRPPSVTSAPSTRTKTPSARPSSRQSDAFSRSVSRAGRPFEIGDNVRIESLGYEGILRYIGEIDGKPGLWVGVELGGGFAGKGKNDGSVSGKRYFACPPNCGVFVASTKLSPPTVGPNCRPSSVASSRDSRITPSLSGRTTLSAPFSLGAGRMTPSASFGRVTPHDNRTNLSGVSGRITPGTTPSVRRTKPIPGLGKSPSRALPSLEAQITSGSRASKYIGLTAKQLSSRPSPSRTDHSLRVPSSPSGIRSSESPFTTPKAGASAKTPNSLSGLLTPGAKSRASLNTPRPRVPSAVAMPPPASPARSASFGSTHSINDDPTQEEYIQTDRPPSLDLTASSLALQDRINRLLGNSTVSHTNDVQPASSPSRSQSTTEADVTVPDESMIATLNTQLEAIQQEKTSLQVTVSSLRSELEQRKIVDKVRNSALSNLTEMEKELGAAERKLSEKASRVESLERLNAQAAAELERAKLENEGHCNDLQTKLDANEALVKSLKDAIEAKEGIEHENHTLLKTKNTEIALLEARLEKALSELETERKELGSQIDELRQAGQETIALYEERLSLADSRRYEMEEKVIVLEEQVKKTTIPHSPGLAAHHATSALEIDNETLREQVQHLQKKLSMMEDTLEDTRAAAEREEVAVRERIKRFKEKEESMRNELTEGRKAVEQVAKAEALAKGRIEEVEEALRESTLALENARAEIETLRSDAATANIDTDDDMSLKVAEVSRQAALERTRLMDEIRHLRDELSQSTLPVGSNKADTNSEDTRWRSMFEHEQAEVQSLRLALDERSTELDVLRKKLNREMPMNSFIEHSRSPSKHESDEIKGLKHIVQELQKESLAITQQNNLLETENRLLRQELKILEDNIEQGLLKQEAALDAGDQPPTLPSDLQTRHDAEMEQLRKRLAEAEMKTARVTHDLNKEISELETLIESKIYREDELEQEVERLRDKLARSKKSSKNSTDPADLGQRRASSASTVTSSDDDLLSCSRDDVCEICERPGHDIFTCDLLKEDAPTLLTRAKPSTPGGSGLYCVDCEGFGHVAADCPHSLDIF